MFSSLHLFLVIGVITIGTTINVVITIILLSILISCYVDYTVQPYKRKVIRKMFFYISEKAVGQQSTIQVTTSGFVTFGERKYPFHQSFLITAKEDKWKVVSDVFRFQAAVP